LLLTGRLLVVVVVVVVLSIVSYVPSIVVLVIVGKEDLVVWLLGTLDAVSHGRPTREENNARDQAPHRNEDRASPDR
jgi:hypothetical protein